MRTTKRVSGVTTNILVLAASLSAAPKSKTQPAIESSVPSLQLLGGRSLIYERSFSSEREVKLKKGFWTRVIDFVAGAPDYHFLVRPYSVVTDSRGRIIVSDPDAKGVHIFDFANQKYKFISRYDGKDAFMAPQCVTVDTQDNIYIADSEGGKIFVYDANGKRELPLPPAAGMGGRREVLDDMRSAIRTGRKPIHDGRWGKATVEVALAIQSSAREGREAMLKHQVSVDDSGQKD